MKNVLCDLHVHSAACVWAAQWRVVPAHNRLAVVPDVCYHTANANLFWRVGHGWKLRALGAVEGGGGFALRPRICDWVPFYAAIRS